MQAKALATSIPTGWVSLDGRESVPESFSALASKPDLRPEIPQLFFEYSYGFDAFCPASTNPEPLTRWQQAMIPKLPTYARELREKLGAFRDYWNQVGPAFLSKAVEISGHSFARSEYSVSLFLCPRTPSMGTPLGINMLSYLESSVQDIPTQDKPLDRFFFASIVLHEVLHKFVKQILDRSPSKTLRSSREPDMVKAHLHLFALRKRIFEALGLASALPAVKVQEASHGTAYARAWQLVHGSPALEQKLIDELSS